MKIYPCTIVKTRYTGVYEGGEWAAFFMDPHEMPPDWDGSDIECIEFWFEFGKGIGIGDTPQEALDNLSKIEMPLQWDWNKNEQGREYSFKEWPSYLRNL